MQDFAIIGDSAHERADGVSIVVAHAERVKLPDQLGAELERELDAHLVRQKPLDPVHDAEQDPRRRKCKHDKEERSDQGLRIRRRFASGQYAIDEILLKLRRRELHRDSDQRHQAQSQGFRPLRPHELPEPASDRLFRKAARACVASDPNPQAAPRAMRPVSQLVGMDG